MATICLRQRAEGIPVRPRAIERDGIRHRSAEKSQLTGKVYLNLKLTSIPIIVAVGLPSRVAGLKTYPLSAAIVCGFRP